MNDAETAIWAEIRTVQEKLVELKRSLNQSSISRPICALPPDILLKIFVLLIDHTHFSKDPTKDARHASQICHRWRGVALTSPTLWAQNLDCNRNSRALFARLLERAGSAPINVVANFHKGYSVYLKAVDNLNAALSRSFQLTSISLVGLPLDNKGAFQQAVGRMKRISLTHIEEALELFQEHNDNIKSLQLLECGNLRVHSLPTFRNLTELAISGPATLRHPVLPALGEGLTIGEWLQYLSSLPQLQSLSILMNAIREEASNGGPFPDIELKHLSTLSLAGTAQHRIDKLLGHIVTPSGCSLNLTYEQNRSSTFQGELLHALKRWFGRWPESSFSSFTNLLYSPEAHRFRIHNKPSEGPPPVLSFRIILENYGSLPMQIMKAMESVISESTTLVLWIARSPTCSTNPLDGLLELKLPKVRTLYLVEQGNDQTYTITDVLGMILGPRAFSPMVKKKDETERLKTVFPELRRIRLGRRLTISVD